MDGMQLLNGPPQYPLVEGPGCHEELDKHLIVLAYAVEAIKDLLVVSPYPGCFCEHNVPANFLKTICTNPTRLKLPQADMGVRVFNKLLLTALFLNGSCCAVYHNYAVAGELFSELVKYLSVVCSNQHFFKAAIK